MSEAEVIVGSESRSLEGRLIVLGVTASVSIYRSVDLARRLMRRGAEIKVVMSSEAQRLVSPTLFEWATGSRSITVFGGAESHIDVARKADMLLIAPATANTIAKISSGVSDTSVTLLAQTMLGLGKPVVVVPAMNKALYDSPIIKEAVEHLRRIGVVVVEPVVEEGKAKYPPVEEVAWRAEALLLRGMDLEGRSLLVTAGPTREYIDPVRFISNPSSGRMGVYIALEAAYRGAEVYLVHGPLSAGLLRGPASVVSVESTEDMLNAVLRIASEHRIDAAIFAAAPADYKPSERMGYKIPSGCSISVRLKPTPKIIDEFRAVCPDSLIVGFAAETPRSSGELASKALEKMRRHGMNIVVANNVAGREAGFSSNYIDALILGPGSRSEKLGVVEKRMLARRLLDLVRDALSDEG